MMHRAYVFAQRKLNDLRDDCRGVTAVEYALLALIAVGVIGTTGAGFGLALSNAFGTVTTALGG